MTNKPSTTLDHAIGLFERNFKNYPYWALHEGKDALRGNRIGNCEVLNNDDDVSKHVEQINYILSNYDAGYYVLITRKKANDTASEQPYRIKHGNVDDSLDFMAGMGIGSIGQSSKNPMQAIMAQALLKGFNQGGGSDVMELKKEIEIIKLRQEYDRELEKERSSVSNRIMGLVENNFDSLLGKLPLLMVATSGANANKRQLAPPPQTDHQQAASEAVSGKMMHELPLSHNPTQISSDAMVHYAKQFSSLYPDINPAILFAKMVALAANDENQARFLFTQLEAQVQNDTEQ